MSNEIKTPEVVESFTKKDVINFAKYCFKKYLVEGYPEEFTHKMLFDMWLKDNK